MQEVSLTFVQEDEGLNLTGTVNFPDRDAVNVSSLSVSGLGEWRHVPANIVHANERTIANLKLVEKASKLSKVGCNFIGIKARHDILLGFSVRHGKNGTKNVQALLTKFFKAIGASSVKFNILDVACEEARQQQDDNDSDQ